MASKLPYMASPGLIPKILEKIQQARRPDRFTQDFLETKLGHSGGSSRAIIPLLKRMGFISSDGSPTTLYDQFRNETTQGLAIASGMKQAYSELFERNEYANELTKEKLTGLITEITGSAKEDRTTQLIVYTFNTMKEMADFDVKSEDVVSGNQQKESSSSPALEAHIETASPRQISSPTGKVGFNIAYTINLNLPETTNPDVFSAIFRALKENLLKE